MRTSSQRKGDDISKIVYSCGQQIARKTPTPVDDLVFSALGSFRKGLRKVSNFIVRKGWVLLLAMLVLVSGCRTIVWLDRTALPEWVEVDPMEVKP